MRPFTSTAVVMITILLVLSTFGSEFSDRRITRMKMMGTYPQQKPVNMIRVETTKTIEQHLNKRHEFGSTPLIVNGENVWQLEFPYQIALMVDFDGELYFMCGGTLLGPRHVMTAAHCMIYWSEEHTYDHYVATGFHNWTLGLDSPHAQFQKVSEANVHRGYFCKYCTDVRNDIAILTVEGHFFETEYVGFAKIASPHMGDFDNDLCYLSGWGAAYNYTLPELLQWGIQYIIPLEDCKNLWAYVPEQRVDNKVICGQNYPVGPCDGDSGSPLTCGGVVTGILSWGIYDCSGCRPEVYTRVSYFYDWIVAIVYGK